MFRRIPFVSHCIASLLVGIFLAGPVPMCRAASTLVEREESPRDFYKFLDGCSREERIEIAIAGRMLPDLKKADFGKYGLGAYYDYADSEEEARDSEKTLRPKTLRPGSFNELALAMRSSSQPGGKSAVQHIAQAIADGRIEAETVHPRSIQRRLLWHSSHWVPYMWRSVDELDYHGVVQWLAKEDDVSRSDRVLLSTFQLEKRICEQYFVRLWDQITEIAEAEVDEELKKNKEPSPSEGARKELIRRRAEEKRTELIEKMEEASGKKLQASDKAAIVAGGGAAALAALSGTVVWVGFAFYTSMSVAICTVAGWLGITLPFAAYVGASTVIGVLSGPVGWVIVIGLGVGGALLSGMPNKDKTRAMVMTIHTIKAERVYGAK